ncbi:hypothetical protein KIPB_005189 [Kipferlia bialata]|uniref:SET domain-containing protein n=1 Tax=Kipferlia bialata TaxID=797122 RepID=A0A9K3CX50_9EUKA|nr:hypothetical protein KIPB_005189 [Kipferlia bialata]|eukprot:g5189.t1
MNHSCSPNCELGYTDSHEVQLLIRKSNTTIRQGEEMTVNYADQNLGVVERTAILSSYGITCDCKRCTRERAALESMPQSDVADRNPVEAASLSGSGRVRHSSRSKSREAGDSSSRSPKHLPSLSHK